MLRGPIKHNIWSSIIMRIPRNSGSILAIYVVILAATPRIWHGAFWFITSAIRVWHLFPLIDFHYYFILDCHYVIFLFIDIIFFLILLNSPTVFMSVRWECRHLWHLILKYYPPVTLWRLVITVIDFSYSSVMRRMMMMLWLISRLSSTSIAKHRFNFIFVARIFFMLLFLVIPIFFIFTK